MQSRPTRPALVAAALCAASALSTQQASAGADPAALFRQGRSGVIVTPSASQDRADPRRPSGHANVHILRPSGVRPRVDGPYGTYETPASLACIYAMSAVTPGCNPQVLSTPPTGGSRTIAVVDAYHYATSAADLAAYSAQFGLPAITADNFTVVYAGGVQPPADPTGGWALEAALDIEMAHALAPGAHIVLVEAASNQYSDLLTANIVAGQIVSQAGGGEVSNSWSGPEIPLEQSFQVNFEAPNTVFLAASGDLPGATFPSALPNVLSVGGTSVDRDVNGNFDGQTSWSSTGGGTSIYLPMPPYQQTAAAFTGKRRAIPDVSLVANPDTGVWIYDTSDYNGSMPGWIVVGGTSAATPLIAAIINNAGLFRTSTRAELRLMYRNQSTAANFTDVVGGACPNAANGVSGVGYDLCTGIGTPLGRYGK